MRGFALRAVRARLSLVLQAVQQHCSPAEAPGAQGSQPSRSGLRQEGAQHRAQQPGGGGGGAGAELQHAGLLRQALQEGQQRIQAPQGMQPCTLLEGCNAGLPVQTHDHARISAVDIQLEPGLQDSSHC